jgi:pseudaminic acid cytidylyltransferase
MAICIIPARAGSKRIPRKNTKDFCGQPIISWVIMAAKASEQFDEIVVSTDDEFAAEIAAKYGVNCIERPENLCDDYTPTKPVIKHALEVFGYSKSEIVACMYPTSVFAKPHYIEMAIDKLKATDADFVFSATEYSHPIQRAFHITDCGRTMPANQVAMSQRTQDLTKSYHDAAQIYVAQAHRWIAKGEIISLHSRAIIMPKNKVVDIDTPEDWAIAEQIFAGSEQ